MIDHLHFSQSYVGILGSIGPPDGSSARCYMAAVRRFSTRRVLNLSIAFGTAATAAYLLLFNEAAAAILSFASGFAAMLATVATVTLAADFCPPRSEGFTFAVMMSIINLATASADIVGSYLFERLFDNRLAPLVLVSAAFTAFAFVLVPLLKLGGKRQGVVPGPFWRARGICAVGAASFSDEAAINGFKRRAFRYCFGTFPNRDGDHEISEPSEAEATVFDSYSSSQVASP